ncbi:MAG: tetratricopeptide repeat protein [Labilithrix sp.]|nr:tetratricopeptide repeat protein [Labilithrix sp.]MCW5817195.1 tetratricopeptide repeat protein [Labilithrix sp.]
MDRVDLERLDRESLVLRAQAAGIRRARVLTRPELVDELLRLDVRIDEAQLKRSRGFFGLARDLLSRVVERGLHLPDAAERFRAALVDPVREVPRPEAQAIPTVTLAEIYAAQGHKDRAIDTLRRVLAEEPDHLAARALLEKLEAKDYVPPTEPLPPEPEVEPVQPDPEPEPEPDPEAEVLTVAPPSERAPIADRCVAVPAGGAHYVWWSLSAASQQLAEESFFFLRIVTIAPSWEGPRVETRDLAADPRAGELVLRDLPADAVVRIAIGFVPAGEFVPVAHSPALELGPGSTLRHWTFDASEPSLLDDAIVRAAAERAAQIVAG